MIIPAMVARWFALGIWAVVAASAVFWGSRLLVKPASAPAHATTVSTSAALRGDLTRLFGEDVRAVQTAAAAAPVPMSDARFKLLGVVAARQPAQGGIALIAVDGKPAKAYRVGATVEGDTVLLAVNARGADLGPRSGAAAVALQIPGLPGPATGSLPSAASPGGVMLPSPAPVMPSTPVLPGVVAPAPAMVPPAGQMQPAAAPGVPILPTASPDDPPAGVGSPVMGGRPAPATR